MNFDGEHHVIPIDDEDRESFKLDDTWLTGDEILEKRARLQSLSESKIQKMQRNLPKMSKQKIQPNVVEPRIPIVPTSQTTIQNHNTNPT